MLKTDNIIIVKRRLELYLDFIINITYKIHTSHPGFDCLYEDEDIKNHYNWCYKSICDDFLKHGVDFNNNVEVKKYLYDFFYKNIYTKKKMESLSYYLTIWNSIFNNKNKNNIPIIYTLYENFDKTLV